MKKIIRYISKYAVPASKTLLAIMVVTMMLVGPIAIPKQVDAQWAVYDAAADAWNWVKGGLLTTIQAVTEFVIGQAAAADFLKEWTLDGIAWSLVNIMLEAILRDTIRWVNSGFQGLPVFLSDPQSFVIDLVDQEIGKFIAANSDLKFLCSPYQLTIRLAIQQNKSYQKRSQCTLTRVINNFENFITGLNNTFGNQGGWAAWHSLAYDNVYGQYFNAEAELQLRIAGKMRQEYKFLDWGKGLFSIPDCTLDGSPSVFGGDPIQGRDADETVPRPWADCKRSTPGAVIENSLNTALGLDKTRLTVADEINELIGALLMQLTKTVLSEGAGLLGLSKPSSQFGGQSYLDSLAQANAGQFSAIRGQTAQEVERDIRLQERYIASKEITLNRAETSENLLNDLISCLRRDLNRATSTPQERASATAAIASASSTLQTINRAIAPIAEDVGETQGFISELQSIRDTLDTFSLNDITRSLFEFDEINKQYINIRGRIRTESQVVSAEANPSTNLGVDFNAIDADTQFKLDQCRGITPVISPPIQDGA